ncbi:hypothetical protein [Haloplanus sp. C73]|uniref:hypothetical protein n=1 Tax=Haloplanus sp. C73 TaxID=3421641 RepID=UPI003EBAEDE5
MTDFTRRETLALVGAVAGAGCSSLPGSDDDESTTLDGAALAALADDAPPTVPERVPVDIAPAHLDATAARARSLLDAVPANLSADQIPNGAIRERVRDARQHAVGEVTRAANTSADYERLSAFADARTDARFAAGAWRAIDAGLTRADLQEEATSVREDRRALRERHEYLGDDPVAALLVHAAIEERLDMNIGTNGPTRYREGNPLGVGELAEDVERARAAVDDAAHLYDQHVEPLGDPPTLRPRYRAARETLQADFESERESLPAVDPERPWEVGDVDVSETPAGEALDDLYRPVDPGYERAWSGDPLARSLVWGHRAFVSLRAFESLRARVADGERFAIESLEDVAAIRSEAVDALRAANDDPAAPMLTRSVLSILSTQLANADARLATEEGEVSARSIRYPVSAYLVAMARARAAPAVSERVASTLG